MSEINQTGGQGFSALLLAAISANIKKRIMVFTVIAGIVTVMGLFVLVVAGLAASTVFILTDAVVLLVLFMDKKKVKKLLSGEGGLSFLKLYGTDLTGEDIIKKLNQDYADGQLLYSRNDIKKRGLQVYLFPQYFVFVHGSKVNVIAENKLYWAYTTVHKQNGIETHRVISLFTEQEEVMMIVMKGQDADEVLNQLAGNYSMWIGFDNNLKKLYQKNRPEFIKKMEDYKWYKKVPV